jgi:hypothetical protein
MLGVVACPTSGNDVSSTSDPGDGDGEQGDGDGEPGDGDGDGDGPFDGACENPPGDEYCFERRHFPGLPGDRFTVAHLDDDPHLDLVISSLVTEEVVVALGDGTGGFFLHGATPMPGLTAPVAVLAGAFAGPVQPTSIAILQPTAGALIILDNDGSGGLSPRPSTTFDEFIWSPAVSVLDYDNDGWDDLALGGFDQSLHFIHNTEGTLVLSDEQVPVSACAPTAVGIRSSINQALELLVSAGACGGARTGVPALRVTGEPPFEIIDMFATGHDAFSLSVGELDGHPGTDAIVNNRLGADFTVLLEVEGNLTPAASLRLSSYCDDCTELLAGEIGNLDGDVHGDIVLIARHGESPARTGLFVLEDALSDTPTFHWLGDGWHDPVVTDIDGDGVDDIIVHDLQSITVLLSSH